MTDSRLPISCEDLHAYADEQLDAGRVQAVEAYLRQHPEQAAEVADYRWLNEALDAAFEIDPGEPIPPDLIAATDPPRARFAVPLAAAAGLLLGIGLTVFAQGFGQAGAQALRHLAENSAAAYAVYALDLRHPVEVQAAEAEHLATWLSKRMDMAFEVPRLGPLGFDLVGGRLMIGDPAPAALLMYENREGKRLVLYLRNDLPEGGGAELRYERAEATGVVTWARGATGFGLAGSFSEAELLPAAQLVQAQLAS